MPFKYCCFTINLTEAQTWTPRTIQWDASITYLVAQLEVATTGQLHWQGYAESKQYYGIKKWQDMLRAPTAHLERRNGTAEQAIQYCQKDDTRQHGPDTNFQYGTKPMEKKTMSTGLNSPYKKALQEQSYDQAINVIQEYCPRDYVLFNNQISNTLRKHFKPNWVRKTNLIFNTPNLDINTMKRKAIVLIGPTGLGKTQYAIQHFQHPLLVSHIDDLKTLGRHNDGIIFDDMNFGHWPPGACIHLTDLELPRSINVKYGTALLPQETPRIFTTNQQFNELWSDKCSPEQLKAIERRCEIIELWDKLY